MKTKGGIIEAAMKYRQIVILIVALMFVLGIYSLVKMPKQEFPAFTIRQGVVVAVYPGATSTEVEEQVTKPLENFIFEFKEVKKAKTHSLSRDGMSIVFVELNDDVNNRDEFWTKFKHRIAAFAAVIYVPAWTPERLALRAQEARITRSARELGWLSGAGQLVFRPVAADDSLRMGTYRRLYQALQYVECEDPERLEKRFGIQNSAQLLEQLPDEQFRAGVVGSSGERGCTVAELPTCDGCLIAAPPVGRAIEVRNYTRLYTEVRYGSEESGTWFAKDTLCVRIGSEEPLMVVSARELLETQMARVGRIPDAYDDRDEAARCDFLDFEKEGVRVIFGWMQLGTVDGEIVIESCQPEMILVR